MNVEHRSFIPDEEFKSNVILEMDLLLGVIKGVVAELSVNDSPRDRQLAKALYQQYERLEISLDPLISGWGSESAENDSA